MKISGGGQQQQQDRIVFHWIGQIASGRFSPKFPLHTDQTDSITSSRIIDQASHGRVNSYITISRSFVVSRAASRKSPELAAVNLPNPVQLTHQLAGSVGRCRISVGHAEGKRIKTGSSFDKESSCS
jgi:hypothetical protein